MILKFYRNVHELFGLKEEKAVNGKSLNCFCFNS